MTQPHKRKPLTLTPERIAKLKKQMQRQERETREKHNLPTERIDAEALLILQGYTCKCGCKQPLDLESEWDQQSPPAGYPVVAHEYFRKGKKSPGHVLGNVWWWRHECNAREAGPETTAFHKGNRFAVNKPVVFDEIEKPKPKKSWPAREMKSRGFQKPPQGYVGPLSKKRKSK